MDGVVSSSKNRQSYILGVKITSGCPDYFIGYPDTDNNIVAVLVAKVNPRDPICVEGRLTPPARTVELLPWRPEAETLGD